LAFSPSSSIIADVGAGSRSFHIGLNAHLLTLSQSYRGAGINNYIQQLLYHLARVDQHNHYVAFLGESRFTADCGLQLQVSKLPTVRPAVRIFWEQFIQPAVLASQKIDLLHAPAFVVPLLTTCPTVVTVHDLSFIHFPQAFRPWNRLYLSFFTAWSVRKARRVVAVSESTRQDVISCFGLPAERVEVVHNGVGDRFRPLPAAEIESFRLRRGLPGKLILFIGTLEPRKNLETLIKAYAHLLARYQSSSDAPKLVIGGAKGWYYERVFAAVEELELTRHVIFPGFIAQEELPWWYGAARLFVYPSYYEGFGLPVLEAMRCGVPVITGNVSAPSEVVGDAGLLVEPMDVEELAEAMYRLLQDATLREELRQLGLERATDFSWERTARETASVYRQVLSSGS
jgi:glycosyltransferase involved in cell wall biosynthesis